MKHSLDDKADDLDAGFGALEVLCTSQFYHKGIHRSKWLKSTKLREILWSQTFRGFVQSIVQTQWFLRGDDVQRLASTPC